MSTIDIANEFGKLGVLTLPNSLTDDRGREIAIQKVLRTTQNGLVAEAQIKGGKGPYNGRCAVKFLKYLSEVRMDRFDNEVRVLGQLDHLRIAKYYGHGKWISGTNEVPWLAQELGGDNLRRHVDTTGVLAPETLLTVGKEMAAALDHVHSKGFIHRDIKPDNFVWDKYATDSILMVDFGIAKRVGEDVSGRALDQFTQHLEFVGPVFFSSPELIAYSKNKAVQVDHRSDLFQFGKVLWYLATGAISAGVPSKSKCPHGGRLHNLVVSMLNDDPEDRPQSAAEIFKLLGAI